MKSRLLIVLTLCTGLILISCQRSSRTYSGRVIELNYDDIDHLRDGSWIKIDGLKFIHFRNRNEGMQHKFSLPTTYTVFDSLNTGRKIGTPVNSRSIALHLSRYLMHVNGVDSLNNSNDSEYVVLNSALASIEGILRVAKRDSSNIIIEVPAEYPAVIRVLD